MSYNVPTAVPLLLSKSHWCIRSAYAESYASTDLQTWGSPTYTVLLMYIFIIH